MDANSLVRGLAAIGAGIAVLAAVGPGISEGMCAASAVSLLVVIQMLIRKFVLLCFLVVH